MEQQQYDLRYEKHLRTAYCDERKTIREIASLMKRSPATIHAHLRKFGIETRKSSDYEPTEKQREWCRRIGKARAGAKLTDDQKAAIAEKARGRRKRSDYEFGGHEKKRPDGYVKVYVPDHPNSTADGYVMKHTLVMERHIGRYLTPDEVVHHENHVRDDNRIENLRLMTVSEHMSMHNKKRHKKEK